MLHTACILADCSTAEFGWETAIWQAKVRYLRSQTQKLIVATTAGREALYERCGVDQFVVHNVPMVRDVWRPVMIYDHDAWRRHGDALRRVTHSTPGTRRITAGNTSVARFSAYIRYGEGTPKSNYVVLHARNRAATTAHARRHNWPKQKWDKLAAALLADGIPVVAIGTPEEALLPAGAEDARGIPLEDTIKLLAGAQLVAGPSSGPLHLASLCGTPHVVWTDRAYNGSIGATNRVRYENLWNPLRTPCVVLDTPETTTTEAILAAIRKEYRNENPGDDTELQPAADADGPNRQTAAPDRA